MLSNDLSPTLLMAGLKIEGSLTARSLKSRATVSLHFPDCVTVILLSYRM